MSLNSAYQIIRGGGVVAIPTETVYGLAGSVFIEKALKQIFYIKKRPFFNPLIVHCASIQDMGQFHDIKHPLLNKMIEHFSPGPLTFVLNKTKKVHPLITAGHKVALRIPSHSLTLKLLQKTGPLCAPSANVFGQLSPTRPEHVRVAFRGKVPILDGGECQGGIESTVIEPDFKNRQLFVLRPGLISQANLRKWLKKVDPQNWTVSARSSNMSPGQLKQHYQPNRPLWIIECFQGKVPTQKEVKDKLLFLSKNTVFKRLQLKKSPALSARELYHQLNILSQNSSHIIYVIKKKEHQKEVWQAIWDRLHKASSYYVQWNSL